MPRGRNSKKKDSVLKGTGHYCFLAFQAQTANGRSHQVRCLIRIIFDSDAIDATTGEAEATGEAAEK